MFGPLPFPLATPTVPLAMMSDAEKAEMEAKLERLTLLAGVERTAFFNTLALRSRMMDDPTTCCAYSEEGELLLVASGMEAHL